MSMYLVYRRILTLFCCEYSANLALDSAPSDITPHEHTFPRHTVSKMVRGSLGLCHCLPERCRAQYPPTAGDNSAVFQTCPGMENFCICLDAVQASNDITLGDVAGITRSSQYNTQCRARIPLHIREEAMAWSSQNNQKRVKTDKLSLDRIIMHLRGLQPSDVRTLARQFIRADGAISDSDLPLVSKGKLQLLDMQGVLHYEYSTESFAQVGGLANLKNWLAKRQQAFLSPAANIDIPKGILLLGVQGSGKSLAAKAVAGLWGLPLLRLDFGSLYNKYYGESEKNLRDSLKLAENMSPCVLWLDEVEKGIAGQSNDDGTSQRVLGTLLTWMAEKTQPVFIVATSNNIANLPPELIRKGRMDEIFFVDLPDEKTRADIFSIHLNKRKQDASAFDLPALAVASDGFSGAEIEQAVVAATYTALAQQQPLHTAGLLDELSRTRPIAVVMAEDISALRNWAHDRTVSAN